MKDPRGVQRGRCKNCTTCPEYRRSDITASGPKCIVCSCPPGQHERTSDGKSSKLGINQKAISASQGADSTAIDSVSVPGLEDSLWDQFDNLKITASPCNFSGCSKLVDFDVNTGREYLFCHDHRGASQDTNLDNGFGNGMVVIGSTQLPLLSSAAAAMVGSMIPKCAIEECDRPRYVDDSGKMHNCCGYSHAMEYQRRQIVKKQKMIKGITHCYLPSCDKLTWPFKNYCGKKHADQGKQMGLPLPPSPSNITTAASARSTSAVQKDSSMCLLPGCTKPKCIDPKSGKIHDYCGQTHADEGRIRGIRPKADKEEDECELPGCTDKKKVEGTRVHNYCCLDHATQDAPNRAARMTLTSDNDVQKFLQKFPNLTVISRKENDHAKPPAGELFKCFKQAFESLPQSQRQTCLAFHGTAEGNIDSICTNGYDPKRRGTSTGQVHGSGEYFATDPSTSMSYCGGKKMILNELLLGQSGVHHTQHGSIIVMKNPDHELPRYVITFQ